MSAYGLTRGAWIAVAAFAGGSVITGALLPSTALLILGSIVCVLAVWLAIDTPPAGRISSHEAGKAMVATTGESSRVEAPVPENTEPHEPRSVRRVPATASMDPAFVLESLMTAADADCTAVAAHLWLADEASGTLRLVDAVGVMPPLAHPVPMDDEDPVALAYSARVPHTGVTGHSVAGSPESTVWRHAARVDAGEASGVAAIDMLAAGRPRTQGLEETMDDLAGSLAGALALHVARTELETAQTLIESARELSRLLDPREVLARALRKAMELSGATTGSIMLLEPDTGRLVIALSRGLPADVVRDTSLAEGEGIAGWVLASGQPMLIEDVPKRSSSLKRHGIRSAVSAPIGDDDGMLGVLNVGSRTFPARFTRSHIAAIEILGRQTATALRNAQAVEGTRELYFDTLRALAIALETKDPYAEGGTERVLECATALGEALGLDADELDALRVAALLHDIGMSAAGDSLLSVDRPLSTVERALLKMHPQIAAEMLAQAPALKHVVPIVYHHHEWYDGEGYLGGLAGEGIPIGARILAVADAYVAMTSDRPYRSAMTEREALRELERKAGTQFDPAVVDAARALHADEANRVPGPRVERA